MEQEKNRLIFNNSDAHLPNVLKCGRLVHNETHRLDNFENPLPVKCSMADSGSQSKSSLGLWPPLAL